MPKLDSNYNSSNEGERGDRDTLRRAMSASDCRALSMRCYSEAGAVKSQPHKSLLTAMGRTWVQLANQIERLQTLQKVCPQSCDTME
jgi:hypothetical protein